MPEGHKTQDCDALIGWNEPWGQAPQLDAPLVFWYQPDEQLEHVLAPEDEYMPAAQTLHEVPPTLKVPAVQTAHAAAFWFEYCPKPHATQVDEADADVSVEYKPAAQAAHEDAPAVDWKAPTEQLVHMIDP